MLTNEIEFGSFWDAWAKAKSLANEGRPEILRQTLARQLGSAVHICSEGPEYVMWETERPVPGFIRPHRFVILVVRGVLGNSLSVYETVRKALRPGDVAFVFPLGNGEIILERIRLSVLPLIGMPTEKVKRLLIGPASDANTILRAAVLDSSSDAVRGALNPYWAQGPVSERMFFGRASQVELLLSTAGSGVAVVGPRGIGKSSLLLAAKRRAPSDVAAIYVDCEVYSKPEEIVEYVMGQLFPKMKAEGRKMSLRELFGRTSRQVVLLLDEADPLIRHCDKARIEEFYGDVKWACANGAKIVMAGYREFRDAVVGSDHSLFNKLSAVELGPFGREDASALILGPVSEIGLTFWENDRAVDRIFTWSSGHPLYTQLFCQKLVDLAVARKTHRMTGNELDTVEKDETIYSFVMTSFVHTTNAIEKCVAFAALKLRSPFDATALTKELETTWGFHPGVSLVMEACERLVLANVFAREGMGFRFLFAAMPSLIHHHQPVNRLMPELIREVGRTHGAK